MDSLLRHCANQGHPSVEELVAAQGLTFPRDPQDLLGNFWPEEESIDDLLMAHKFGELEAKMPPEAITASDAAYRRLKESMALEEPRDTLRSQFESIAADD